MMASLRAVVTEVLEAYTGRIVADTCVRASAIAMGKTADDLGADDLPALESNIRRILNPVAGRSTVDELLLRIERGVQ